ncbi:SAGA-associated factor 29 homolog A isoform X2 [Rhodamnia argentea]|uniref:SAGA-associated factor 29 homolog A isoform X2 n=1 Tax=Rhodamnia argentea TaxID=178133 RepID=A0A8B8P7W5_9MYRT|nr:SAGA-associated factor 29 homolog A isoform X2 [Rhodamnia argentea]
MSSTAMSSTAMAGILESSRELDRLKKEQEDVLVEINKLHKKLQTTPEVVEKLGDTSLSKLKHLYTHAKELSEAEVTASTVMLNQLDTLLLSGPPGQPRRKIDSNDQKRKRMKNDSEISRMSSSMRSQLEVFASLKGQQVAARVTEDADKDEWFIVKVTNFDRETREFEVLDEEPGDDEESGGQRKYKVPVSHIIPFPKQNDPSGAQDFPSGSHVLAVYPGTTALYKATVVNSRKRKTEDYLLEFDDDEEDGAMPQRNVPFYNVVPLPEGHRQ